MATQNLPTLDADGYLPGEGVFDRLGRRARAGFQTLADALSLPAQVTYPGPAGGGRGFVNPAAVTPDNAPAVALPAAPATPLPTTPKVPNASQPQGVEPVRPPVMPSVLAPAAVSPQASLGALDPQAGVDALGPNAQRLAGGIAAFGGQVRPADSQDAVARFGAQLSDRTFPQATAGSFVLPGLTAAPAQPAMVASAPSGGARSIPTSYKTEAQAKSAASGDMGPDPVAIAREITAATASLPGITNPQDRASMQWYIADLQQQAQGAGAVPVGGVRAPASIASAAPAGELVQVIRGMDSSYTRPDGSNISLFPTMAGGVSEMPQAQRNAMAGDAYSADRRYAGAVESQRIAAEASLAGDQVRAGATTKAAEIQAGTVNKQGVPIYTEKRDPANPYAPPVKELSAIMTMGPDGNPVVTPYAAPAAAPTIPPKGAKGLYKGKPATSNGKEWVLD